MGHAIALETGLFNVSRVLGPAVAGICLSLLGQAVAVRHQRDAASSRRWRSWLVPPDPAQRRGRRQCRRRKSPTEVGILAGIPACLGTTAGVLRIFLLLGILWDCRAWDTPRLIPAYAQKLLGTRARGATAPCRSAGGSARRSERSSSPAIAASQAPRPPRQRVGWSVAGTIAGRSAGLAPGLLAIKAGLPVAVALMFINGMGDDRRVRHGPDVDPGGRPRRHPRAGRRPLDDRLQRLRLRSVR